MLLLIGKDDCSYCNEIKDMLNTKNIEYKYADQRNVKSEMLNFFKTKQTFYPYIIDIKEFQTFEDMKLHILWDEKK